MKEIKVDPISAMLEQQNRQLLKAYKEFGKVDNDFWKLVRSQKVDYSMMHRLGDMLDSLNVVSYEELVSSNMIGIGRCLEELKRLAIGLHTNFSFPEWYYKEVWNKCATSPCDEDGYLDMVQFCKDYRADEQVSEVSKQSGYQVGDKLVSHDDSGLCWFDIEEIKDGKMVIRKCYAGDRKLKEVDVNSLSYAANNRDWRYSYESL